MGGATRVDAPTAETARSGTYTPALDATGSGYADNARRVRAGVLASEMPLHAPQPVGASQAVAQQPFVGRERELSELNRHLGLALSGRGQVCFVTGQAGSGKTALVRHFVEQALAADASLIVANGSCNAQTGIGDPYLPFREVMAMLTSGDSSGETGGALTPENTIRLRTVMVRAVQVLIEVAPELIGIFVPGASLVGHLGRAVTKKVGWMDRLDELADRKVKGAEPVAEQRLVLEQYTAFLQQLSAKTPLILFLDDLQWADSASLGMLFHLGRHIETSRILILGAYRPNDVALGRDGQRHPLEPLVHELTRYYGDITVDLDAIPETVNRAFVNALVDAQPNRLGPSFRQVLFHRTGGHALFTVELVRHMQERGDLVPDGDGMWVEGPALEWDALPVRVEGVIAERINRLGDELRELLTVASVEGEQFTAEVVARAQAISEREAIRQLSHDLDRQHRLISAQGFVTLGPVHLSLYRFLHNLFQQYLYNSLDEAERMYLHQDVGEVLEALFEGHTEEVAAQLARHFEEAGAPEKAVLYRLQAGNRARRMSAHGEAAIHLTRGLELLATLPEGPDRSQMELHLQAALGVVSVANHGYASPQVEQAFIRTRDLARAFGALAYEIPAIYGLSAYHFVRGELDMAYEQGEQLLSLAEGAGEEGYAIGALQVMAAASYHQTRPDRAVRHAKDMLVRYDPVRDRDLAYHLGHDPKVTALCYIFLGLHGLGYPDQALATQDAAVELAQELNHPYTMGLAASFSAMLLHRLRRPDECRAQAELALAHGNRAPYPIWQALGEATHGWALALQGRPYDGVEQVRRGLALWEGSGARLALPYLYTMLAEACLLAGRPEEGLGAIDSSFGYPAETWWNPEQHRLRGELLLLLPGREVEAEAAFRLSMDSAASQAARMLELRAATSLASLLLRLGRKVDITGLLAERYAWFSEGLDTPDLQAARNLLEDIAERP